MHTTNFLLVNFKFSLLFITFTFTTNMGLQAPDHYRSLSSDDDRNMIASCLARHNINNFTIFPDEDSTNSSSAATYYEVLDFSIQNLRFTDPATPKPLAILLPESVDQLVKCIECCKEEGFEIRVRCGGHSYEGTSSSTGSGGAAASPFVIIDMMNLNKVSVDVEAETAWVEGGATLGETYAAIVEASEDHGFSAGSCPTVGAGGHIAGGGFGLLSRKHGLAADNVVDAILVDANGRVLDKEAMGEDVFWAIRGGGGGGWGIVYAWKIKLVRVPKVVTGFVLSSPGSKSRVGQLVNKWQYVAPKLASDFYLSCFVGAGLPETRGERINNVGVSATFKGFYLGPRSEMVAIMDRVFPELGLLEEDCKEMSWIESILFFSGLGDGRSSMEELRNRYLQEKNYFKAKSDYVRTEIPLEGIMAALDIFEEEPKGYVILDPYGGMMHKISSEAIAFPHRMGNLFTIQYLVEWKEKDNPKSGRYMEWIRGLYDAMTPFVSKNPRAAYINYIDFDIGVMMSTSTAAATARSLINLQINGGGDPGEDDDEDDIDDDQVERARVWGEKYFLNNFDRLVKAKTLIDPDNVFNNQQSIPAASVSSSSSLSLDRSYKAKI